MYSWTEEYRTMIEDCENRSDLLSSEESTFIDSIDRQLSITRNISPRQIEILEKIWGRVTSESPTARRR